MKTKTNSSTRVSAGGRRDVTHHLRFTEFRRAIRSDSIDALVAKRLFRRHYSVLRDICERECCSIAKARTINACLEGDVDAALRRAGQPGLLKSYDSVKALLEDLEA